MERGFLRELSLDSIRYVYGRFEEKVILFVGEEKDSVLAESLDRVGILATSLVEKKTPSLVVHYGRDIEETRKWYEWTKSRRIGFVHGHRIEDRLYCFQDGVFESFSIKGINPRKSDSLLVKTDKVLTQEEKDYFVISTAERHDLLEGDQIILPNMEQFRVVQVLSEREIVVFGNSSPQIDVEIRKLLDTSTLMEDYEIDSNYFKGPETKAAADSFKDCILIGLVINKATNLLAERFPTTSKIQTVDLKLRNVELCSLDKRRVFLHCGDDDFNLGSVILRNLFASFDKLSVVVAGRCFVDSDLRREIEEKYCGSIVVISETCSTENLRFDESFFDNVDLIVSCGGDSETRGFMGSLSVRYSKRLVDAGVSDFRGHVQNVIPGFSESYGCVSDPVDVQSYPYCVIKSFPSIVEHCVIWAKDKLENLFYKKPLEFNKFWIESDMTDGNTVLPENGTIVYKLLNERPRDFADCVVWARNKFEKYFNHKPKNLLMHFPPRDSFWTFPKRCPTPIQFDQSKHIRIVVLLANLFAILWSIKKEEEEEKVSQILKVNQDKVIQYIPSGKTIVTDETLDKEDVLSSSRLSSTESILTDLAHFKTKPIQTLSFEKVNNERQLEELKIELSKIRCDIYGIPQPDPTVVKMISGNRKPCLPSTTAIIGGLAVLECQKNSNFYNWWTTYDEIIHSSVNPCPVIRISAKLNFTLWDTLTIKGNSNWTIQDFLKEFRDRFEVSISMIVQGSKMVYVDFMPTHLPRKTKLISKFLKFENGYASIHLTGKSFEENGTEDQSLPLVKYYSE